MLLYSYIWYNVSKQSLDPLVIKYGKSNASVKVAPWENNFGFEMKKKTYPWVKKYLSILKILLCGCGDVEMSVTK